MMKERGECQVCGRMYVLRADGKIRQHSDFLSERTGQIHSRIIPFCRGSLNKSQEAVFDDIIQRQKKGGDNFP